MNPEVKISNPVAEAQNETKGLRIYIFKRKNQIEICILCRMKSRNNNSVPFQ